MIVISPSLAEAVQLYNIRGQRARKNHAIVSVKINRVALPTSNQIYVAIISILLLGYV